MACRFLKFKVVFLGSAMMTSEERFKSDLKNLKIRRICIISNLTSDEISKKFCMSKKIQTSKFLGDVIKDINKIKF